MRFFKYVSVGIDFIDNSRECIPSFAAKSAEGAAGTEEGGPPHGAAGAAEPWPVRYHDRG